VTAHASKAPAKAAPKTAAKTAGGKSKPPVPVKAASAKTASAKTAPSRTVPAATPAAKSAPQAPAAAKPITLTPAPIPAAGAPIAFPAGVVPRKPGRGTPKYFVAPVQAPLPPPTSRFADRFAPPRPPTRQMKAEEVDTPREKQKADPKLANAWKSKSGRDLSDAEILAMPDSEYMNEKQIEFFKAKLDALKEDLLSNAGETTEHLREDTSIVPDPADRATIEEEHALELRTRDRERKLLKKISQSLARLESGEYGFCDETGEPIGLGRLIARPTATLSLEAQQRRELKQKMFGD
jgi:DnaK suppressor protein